MLLILSDLFKCEKLARLSHNHVVPRETFLSCSRQVFKSSSLGRCRVGIIAHVTIEKGAGFNCDCRKNSAHSGISKIYKTGYQNVLSVYSSIIILETIYPAISKESVSFI
jgi:hypothetical protein